MPATVSRPPITGVEWVSVATGPGEFKISGSTDMRIAWAGAAPPSGVNGHFLPQDYSEPCVLGAGEYLWVRKTDTESTLVVDVTPA